MTITELQDALVHTCIIDRDAIDDPEGYDEGSTVAQIDELHKMLPDDTALLRQALAQLEINRTNFRKGPSKSICKMLAGGNDEVISALRERLGETK